MWVCVCWRAICVCLNRRFSAEASAAQDASLHPEQTVRLPTAIPGEVWEPAAAANQRRLPPHGETAPLPTTTPSVDILGWKKRAQNLQPAWRLEQFFELPLSDVTRGTSQIILVKVYYWKSNPLVPTGKALLLPSFYLYGFFPLALGSGQWCEGQL